MAELPNIYENNRTDLISGLNSILEIMSKYIEGEEEIDPRDELQFEIYNAVRDFFAYNSDNSGDIYAPPGTGKTNVFTAIALMSGITTVITAPNNTIIAQTEERIRFMAKSLDLNPYIRVINEHRKDPPIDNLKNKDAYTQEIILINNSSLVLENEYELSRIVPEEVGLVIQDEMHLANSEKRIDSRKMFESAIELGFTGSPHGLDNNIIFAVSIKECIERKILAPTEIVTVSLGIESQIIEESESDTVEKEIDSALSKINMLPALVKFYQQHYPENDKQGLYFVKNIEQAEELAKLFNNYGITAFAYHSNLNHKERDKIDKAFRNNEFPILIAVATLEQGWDYPDLSLVVSLPTASPNRLIQQFGRGTRLTGDKHFTFVQIVLNWEYNKSTRIQDYLDSMFPEQYRRKNGKNASTTLQPTDDVELITEYFVEITNIENEQISFELGSELNYRIFERTLIRDVIAKINNIYGTTYNRKYFTAWEKGRIILAKSEAKFKKLYPNFNLEEFDYTPTALANIIIENYGKYHNWQTLNAFNDKNNIIFLNGVALYSFNLAIELWGDVEYKLEIGENRVEYDPKFLDLAKNIFENYKEWLTLPSLYQESKLDRNDNSNIVYEEAKRAFQVKNPGVEVEITINDRNDKRINPLLVDTFSEVVNQYSQIHTFYTMLESITGLKTSNNLFDKAYKDTQDHFDQDNPDNIMKSLKLNESTSYHSQQFYDYLKSRYEFYSQLSTINSYLETNNNADFRRIFPNIQSSKFSEGASYYSVLEYTLQQWAIVHRKPAAYEFPAKTLFEVEFLQELLSNMVFFSSYQTIGQFMKAKGYNNLKKSRIENQIADITKRWNLSEYNNIPYSIGENRGEKFHPEFLDMLYKMIIQ